MTEEDSKYLAKEIGIDWLTFINLLKWEQFGVVWEWAKKKEWFEDFLLYIWEKIGKYKAHYGFIHYSFIGPRFTEELVEFLRGREK